MDEGEGTNPYESPQAELLPPEHVTERRAGQLPPFRPVVGPAMIGAAVYLGIVQSEVLLEPERFDRTQVEVAYWSLVVTLPLFMLVGLLLIRSWFRSKKAARARLLNPKPPERRPRRSFRLG